MQTNDKNAEKLHCNISNKRKGFTLVELIIVITILAILATIAFISFQNYTKDSRDGNRLATITQIQKGLELSVLKTGKYPNPDEVYGTGVYEPTTTDLNYVGYIGENISRLININKTPIDPVTGDKYVYGVSANHQKYQLATTLENLQTNTLIPTTYANGTQARVTGNYTYPLRLGNYLYSLPSLIFVGSEITSTGFVIDKGSNLPYKLNAQTPDNTQTITTQLQQLTGSSSLTLNEVHGVEIPNNLTSQEFKNNEIPAELLALGITDKNILGTAIFGNSYFSETSVGSSSSSSNGGGETPPGPPPTVGQNMSTVSGQEALYAGVYQGRTLWVAGTGSTSLQWKTSNTSTLNASHPIDGRANTGTLNSEHPASDYCQNLNWAGHTDWYLPAMSPNDATITDCSTQTGELQFLYCQHKGNGSQALLGFASTSYWSSTETNTNNARGLYFHAGYWYGTTKSLTHSVRCVRLAD